MIGDPIIPVECNECGEVYDFRMTALVGGCWDDRNLEPQMKRGGWMVQGDETVCPDCAKEPK